MSIMLILIAAAMGLVLVMLAVVVVGIKLEPSAQELTRHAPRLMASLTRRLLGVSGRWPDPSVITTDQQRGEPSQASDPAPPPDRTRPAQIRDI